MKRIEEVFDCWFESGAMPYASALCRFDADFNDTDKYVDRGGTDSTQSDDLSHVSREELLKYIDFPADFIAEGIDQTRGWFYTLMVLGVALYNQSPFKNVVVNGIILAEDGQKMSKRLKNYPDPNDIINKYGADAMRFYLLSSPTVRGETLNFSEKGVDEVYKKVVLLVLNVVKFWKLYAGTKSKIKNQKSKIQIKNQKLENILDQWVLARLNQLIGLVTESLDNYEIDQACRPIQEFINDLSTWYLRRSRERFKAENQNAKCKMQNLIQNSKCRNTAIEVLGYVLLEFSKILAPVCPFLAEYIYKNVPCSMFHVPCKDSVHLEKWPQVLKLGTYNMELLNQMQQIRKICEIGHSLRAQAGIKVRQGLRKFKIQNSKFKITIQNSKLKELIDLVRDELNIKEVEIAGKLPEGDAWVSKDGVALYTVIDKELKQEGIVRELTRQINFLRKKRGLTIEDRVVLKYATKSDELARIIKKYKQELKQTVLASEINLQKELDGEVLKIEGEEVVVRLGN